jgi:hypothetical protein
MSVVSSDTAVCLAAHDAGEALDLVAVGDHADRQSSLVAEVDGLCR